MINHSPKTKVVFMGIIWPITKAHLLVPKWINLNFNQLKDGPSIKTHLTTINMVDELVIRLIAYDMILWQIIYFGGYAHYPISSLHLFPYKFTLLLFLFLSLISHELAINIMLTIFFSLISLKYFFLFFIFLKVTPLH